MEAANKPRGVGLIPDIPVMSIAPELWNAPCCNMTVCWLTDACCLADYPFGHIPIQL